MVSKEQNDEYVMVSNGGSCEGKGGTLWVIISTTGPREPHDSRNCTYILLKPQTKQNKIKHVAPSRAFLGGRHTPERSPTGSPAVQGLVGVFWGGGMRLSGTQLPSGRVQHVWYITFI